MSEQRLHRFVHRKVRSQHSLLPLHLLQRDVSNSCTPFLVSFPFCCRCLPPTPNHQSKCSRHFELPSGSLQTILLSNNESAILFLPIGVLSCSPGSSTLHYPAYSALSNFDRTLSFLHSFPCLCILPQSITFN